MMDQRDRRIAHTNARVALAKQYLEELMAIGPLEKGINGRLSESQRSRRRELISELSYIYRQFDAFLPIAVSGNSAFLNTESLLRVYCEDVLPYRNAIHELLYEDLDPERREPRDPTPGPERNRDVARFFHQATADLQDHFEDESHGELYASFRFPEDIAHEIALVDRMGLFQPDEWIENNDYLLPVVTEKPLQKIPARVRSRLDEIYDLFRLGQWRACVALSRALLELVLINEKHFLEGSVFQEDESGGRWTKPIGELIEMADRPFPELKDAMETIVQWANQTLHPGRGDVPMSKLDRVERTWALECVSAIRLVCGRIYCPNSARDQGAKSQP